MLPRSPTTYAALVLARAGVTAADTSRGTTPCPQLNPAARRASTGQSVAWSPYRLCVQHNARSVDHEPVDRRTLSVEDRVSKRWMPRSLDDVPHRLILSDGVCVLCCWWVRFVIERDASARFRFVAIQSIRGSALATRIAVDVASPETNVAIINGHAYFKSDAMILVLAGLPGWSWSRIFLLLPRRVRDWAYDRIARNRYRLFGRNESCLVPTSAIAARFVLDDPSGEQP
jgi:predicted DCC family thiol-disulfide oxidoreductase YuxK